MAGSQSEFYTLELTTTPTPIDLGGAVQVAFTTVNDSVRVQGHADTSDGNYLLFNSATGTLVMNTADERLYVRADSTTATLHVWVAKGIGWTA